jgi:hypothetical protein
MRSRTRADGKKIDEIEMNVNGKRYTLDVRMMRDSEGAVRFGIVHEESELKIQGPALPELEKRARTHLEGWAVVEWSPWMIVQVGERWSRSDFPNPELVLNVSFEARASRGDTKLSQNMELRFGEEEPPESIAEALAAADKEGMDPLDRPWTGRWERTGRHVSNDRWAKDSTHESREEREARRKGMSVRTTLVLPATIENVEAVRAIQRRLRDLNAAWGSYMLTYGTRAFPKMLESLATGAWDVAPIPPRPGCPDCGMDLGDPDDKVDFAREMESHKADYRDDEGECAKEMARQGKKPSPRRRRKAA